MSGAQPDDAILVYSDETGAQRTTRLTAAGLSVGRARDNGLSFPAGVGVSRHHAELAWDGYDWLVIDRGSSRGTFVNDVRVVEQALTDGDVIRLGPPSAPSIWFRRASAVAELDAAVDDLEAANEMTVMVPGDSLYLNPALLSRAASEEGAQSSSRLAERIKALYQITSELLAVADTDELCARLTDMIFETLPADRCALLFSDEGGQLVQRCLRTRPGHDPESFTPSRTITRKVARDNLAILSMDAAVDDRFASGQSVFMQSIRAVMCSPVSSVGKVFGVAYLDTVATGGSFDESDLEFLVAVCRQAAMALEKLHLLDEQKKTFESMIRAFARSIDARDEMTAGHSSRVAKYSQAIARYMGMDRAECKRLWYAGLLHDLGKIGTREAVLCKAGPLTPDEYEHIKEHPRHTLKILSAINFTADMADIPRVASSHHERIDGAGYPFGWKGDEIPMGGRIIAVADFFDALTAKRHYREPMPLDEVIALMEKGRDCQFDSVVLDAFRQYFDNEYVPGVRRTAARRASRNPG